MEPINIFISGDFAPRLRVKDCIEKGEYASLYNDILDTIRKSDYAITNLEAPCTDTATPIRKTGPNLIAPSKTIEALKYASFDMVTLANNHAMDQGVEGLTSTLRLLRQNNIAYIGAGLSIEEKQTTRIVNIKGKNIAFINCCENEWSTSFDNGMGCNPLDEVSLYYQIEEARQKADYCIIIIHGGHEMYGLPSPRMKKLYHWFIDIGADAVIGHHTHCYCGREIYHGKPIIYSLGNFIFDHPRWRTGPWTEACACMLHLSEDNIEIQMIPFTQCNDDVGIHLLDKEAKNAFQNLDRLKTNIIQDDTQLSDNYLQYLKGKINLYEAYIEPSFGRLIHTLKKMYIIPPFLSAKKRQLLFNLVRCEAHRDALLYTLKRTSK